MKTDWQHFGMCGALRCHGKHYVVIDITTRYHGHMNTPHGYHYITSRVDPLSLKPPCMSSRFSDTIQNLQQIVCCVVLGSVFPG